MLKILGRANAYNVQKVLWFLEELSVEYEHINVGSLPGELDTGLFLSMNPNARIPVIQDGELFIWESNTIIRYLASSYGNGIYSLGEPAERTFIERWMDWELATLQPDFISLFWGYYRTPENNRNDKEITCFAKRCEMNLSVLNSHLKNTPYVANGRFSVADVCVGTSFYRYQNMGLDVRIPIHVNRWYERLIERPSFQSIIMVEFDELKGRLEF